MAAFGMLVEFWTTITFEAQLLIVALLLAGIRSENYGPLLSCYLTSVKELDFYIFKTLSFQNTPAGWTTNWVDRMERELPQTCVPCWHRHRRGWRRRCRRRRGGCGCRTESHARNCHSRAAGNTDNAHSTVPNPTGCWELQGTDMTRNFNSIVKTATGFGQSLDLDSCFFSCHFARSGNWALSDWGPQMS